MQKRGINPQTWLNGFHMNQGIEVTNGQRVLYVSGQTSNDATGASMHEGDLTSQFKLVWKNLVEVLEASNMTAANIVRLTIYTTDVDAFLTNAAEFSGIWHAQGCKPVGTLLGVQRLFTPSTMIEIEPTAVA